MRSAIIVMALFFSVVGDSQAQMNDKVVVYGAGADSCGEYVKARRGKLIAADRYKQWAYGFFTAVSIYNPAAYGKTLVDNESGEGFLLWLENWCELKPLANFYNAVYALHAELLPGSEPAVTKKK